MHFRVDLPNLPVGGKKRPLAEEENDMVAEDCGDVKRPCPQTGPGTSTAREQNLDKILNFPLPSTESIGCIAKIYADEELPLNEVLEVVGIVSFNSPGFSSESEDREDFHPPSSVVPRIHCISAQRWLHNNPHLCRSIGSKWEEGMLDACLQNFNLVHVLIF